jgi:hypothetical protein
MDLLETGQSALIFPGCPPVGSGWAEAQRMGVGRGNWRMWCEGEGGRGFRGGLRLSEKGSGQSATEERHGTGHPKNYAQCRA